MNKNVLIAAYQKELEAEYKSSRKCLERIPETLFDFKPHPKSMAMGYLALLVAEIPLWITCMIEQGEIDFDTFRHAEIKTTQELVDHFKANVEGAKKALEQMPEGDLEQLFQLKNHGQVVYSIPRGPGIGSTLNHWVHHRGQLTVYMRLNDIEVPSIYGPSADDKSY